MHPYRNLGLTLLTGALLIGFASSALAAGTLARTPIDNTATLSYSIGGVPQPDIDSDSDGDGTPDPTRFLVASKVNLAVTAETAISTVTGADQVLTFKITNTGNDTQRYGLELYAGANGEAYGAGTDAFNMNNVRVYTDSDNNFANGGTTLIDAAAPTNGTLLGTLTGSVGADGVLFVHVVADVPAGRAAGDDAIYTLKARTYQIAGRNGGDGSDGSETGNSSTPGDLTTNGTPNTGVALADDDDDLSDSAVGTASDAANNGDGYATAYYEVATASISVRKTATVLWDPVNGNSNPVAIPGAYVQYAITVTNGAGAGSSATLTEIIDILANELKIDPDFFTGVDLDPTDGPYGSGIAGNGFRVSHVTGRTATATPRYFTTSTADGVLHDGSVLGGQVTMTYATLLPAEAGPPVYTAGELKPGESVTLTFNVIVQ